MTQNQIELKSYLLASLLTELENERSRALAASVSARSGSTHEDATAKSKYETQSTELSYLANGQALRARDLAENIETIKNFILSSESCSTIALGSIVEIGDETVEKTSNIASKSKRYFIVPVASGRELQHEGSTYITLTPNTPKGRELVGLMEGDCLNDESKFVKRVY